MRFKIKWLIIVILSNLLNDLKHSNNGFERNFEELPTKKNNDHYFFKNSKNIPNFKKFELI